MATIGFPSMYEVPSNNIIIEPPIKGHDWQREMPLGKLPRRVGRGKEWSKARFSGFPLVYLAFGKPVCADMGNVVARGNKVFFQRARARPEVHFNIPAAVDMALGDKPIIALADDVDVNRSGN
jgi:hypothetical protein